MGCQTSSLALILITLLPVQPAKAVDTANCGQKSNWIDVAAVNEAMSNSGQHIYASAASIAGYGAKVHVDGGVLFTTDDAHKEGYIIRTNNVPGLSSTQGCILRRLTNLRFPSTTGAGTSPKTLLKATNEDAMKGCNDLAKVSGASFPRASCGFLNNMLNGNEHINRVIAQGFEVAKRDDGTLYQSEWLTTITAHVDSIRNPSSRSPEAISGIFSTKASSGATFVDSTILGAAYTAYGLRIVADE